MDPQQELFTALRLALEDEEYDVYDAWLPSEGTPYPFIYLADSQLTDRTLKNAVIGELNQTIHVWHNDPRKRGTVSSMLLAIKTVCRRIERTTNFGWMVTGIDQQILHDNTTSEPLLHGWLQVTFKFS